MAKLATLDIGEVAQETGLPASTLRYYESIGLINSCGRNGLRRLYEPEVIDQLAFVRLGRLAGFTLKEIASMGSSEHSIEIDREKIKEKAQAVELHINRLNALKTMLMHVANCPEEDHSNCPKFRRLLQVAKRLRVDGGF